MTMGAGALDDARLERLLLLSGRRSILLSDTRLTRIRAALLSENTRLARDLVRLRERAAVASDSTQQSHRPKQRVQLAKTLGGALCVAGILLTYVIWGGARMPPVASIRGDLRVSELRTGPLGLTWRREYGLANITDAFVRGSDRIAATSTSTVTFGTGATAIADPGTALSIEPDGTGVTLDAGALRVSLKPNASTGLLVHSGFGTIAISDGEADLVAGLDGLRIEIHSGQAQAQTDAGTVTLGAGEQLMLKRGMSTVPVPELQAPRIVLTTSASGEVSFNARIVPGGVLIAIDASGREVARFQADTAGLAVGECKMDRDAASGLRFYQEDANSVRRSGLSAIIRP